jgi:hypothetical protein
MFTAERAVNRKLQPSDLSLSTWVVTIMSDKIYESNLKFLIFLTVNATGH